MFLLRVTCIVALALVGLPAFSQWHIKPEMNSCSLSDVHTRVLSSQMDAIAARAHHVFERLLNAWEGELMPPKLSVIECGERVLALSQSSGHVLITRQAVKLSLEGVAGEREGPLAFVLAHELIHQLNDFSTPHPPLTSPFVESIVGRERERIADAHAVILMALAGFDPYEVSNNRDFFRRWTEAGLGVICSRLGNPTETAQCLDAQTRSAAIHNNLQQLAERTTLFEFGLQAFTIGRYDEAISAFEDFGQVFRSAQVLLNLGLAHFARAVQLSDSSMSPNAMRHVMFPTILASNPGFSISRSTGPQGLNSENAAYLRARHIKKAIESFSQVIRLQPMSESGYAHLIFAFILDGKLGMASGVWKDQYPKSFRVTPLASLVEALIDVAEKRNDRARERLLTLDNRLRHPEWADTSFDMMRYTVCQNRSGLALDGSMSSRLPWLELASWARGKGRTLLFQLALLQLQPNGKLVPSLPVRHRAPWHVGEDVAHFLSDRALTVLPLALEETTLSIFSPRTNVRLVADAKKKRIHHVWSIETASVIQTLDELLAYYGPPDRHITTEAGQYLAYTQRGIGFKIVETHLTAVFYFASSQNADLNIDRHQAIAE